MANKQKKKRNKQYRGQEAAMTRPAVTRITAVNRSKVGQWWFDRKRVLKPIIVATVVAIVVVILVVEIIRLATA